MWPWAHLATAYLLFAAVVWYRGGHRPTGAASIALALGALAPDLIDKPLAWYVPLLPNGRAAAHSLLIGGVVVALIAMVGRRSLAGAGPFSVGYLAHLLGDALQPVVSGNLQDLSFLLWPMLSTPMSYEGAAAVIRAQRLTPFFGFEIVVTIAGVALWSRQGRPGVGLLRRRLGVPGSGTD